MTAYRKNILVGGMVLGGILIFGWMILHFSSRLVGVLAAPQMAVRFDSTRADGVSDGSSVQFLGVTVGRVTAVRRKSDDTGVIIDAMVDRSPPLPANVRATISSTNALGGTAFIYMDIEGHEAQGRLAEGAIVQASYVGLQLLPTEITNMSDEIAKVARQLRESNAINDLDATIKKISTTAEKTSQLFDSLNKSVGDPATTEDFRQSIVNLRQASDSAAKAVGKFDVLADKLQKNSDEVSSTVNSARDHIDTLSKSLGERLVQLSAVLGNVQEITQKLDKGQGAAGQLMNDPQLYKSLVDSARELNATVTDLHRLIDQWEQEGVTLKVK